MNLSETQTKFINLWSALGTSWGISRSMAQVHALLLVVDEPLSTEDAMSVLQISRGNANMSLRELMNWNLIYKVNQLGERKEFFEAEKDVWLIAKRILKERKRREIEPLMEQLALLENEAGKDEGALRSTIADIRHMITRMDTLSEKIIKADEHKILSLFTNMLKK